MKDKENYTIVRDNEILKFIEENYDRDLFHSIFEEILKSETSMPWEKRKELISMIGLHIDMTQDMRVIDLCCGKGTDSFIISELYPNVKITGIDIDETKIKIAKLIAEKEYKKSYINFFVEDVVNLDYSIYNFMINSAINISFNNVKNSISFYREREFSGYILFMFPSANQPFEPPGFTLEVRDNMIKETVKHFKGIKLETRVKEKYVLSEALLVKI